MPESERQSGSKRSYMETTTTTTPVDLPFQVKQLRLEGIFYPKFENETGERTIRSKMLSDATGYLEVSTKHSGSLLLWSGGSRFYSKNSLDNAFSAAGEILLRQHFRLVCTKGDDHEQVYQECSNFVEESRLTLSFEVVTTVLGDHGDRPQHDFLILTAVGNRNTQTFHSTPELIAFAQQFRLPHNDYWIFHHDVKDKFFDVFDDIRETGTASTVVPRLTEAASISIPSMYPHLIFQGDIMEGIVVRHVTSTDGDVLGRLAQRAQEVVLSESLPHGSGINLRDIRKDAFDMEDFGERLKHIVNGSRSVERFPRNHFDIPALADSLVDSPDRETALIAQLVSKLSKMTEHCNLVVSCEKTAAGKSRYIVIVHLILDFVFQKFNKQREPGDLPLFRGFSFELVGGEALPSVKNVEATTRPMDVDSDVKPQEETLMLKMKFLPYMVRTFGCRNGLRTVRANGREGFVRYTGNLLEKWKISDDGRKKWLPFFRGWGHYAAQCFVGNAPAEAQSLQVLDSSNYLEHLEVFTALYESNALDISDPRASSLRGLVVVISLDDLTATKVADFIAKDMGAERISGVKNVTSDVMLQSHLGGYVCSSTVNEGFGRIPKFMKSDEGFVKVILFQCADEDIVAALLPKSDEKKALGSLKGWRKLDVIDLPRSSLFPCDESFVDDNEAKAEMTPSKEFQELMQSFTKSEDVDERPGLLVFFPGIPGCGKSACVSLCESHIKFEDRKLAVLEGDKTEGKRLRTLDTPGVMVADKNAPMAIWGAVGDICAATKALAVPAIPDALETTRVVGVRNPDGEVDVGVNHVYPFSLRFLAVCIARVLRREKHTHAGNLDNSVPFVSMIVVKFFSLYRRCEASDMANALKERIASAGGSCSDPIMLPFFNETVANELPLDLQNVLMEALQCQYGYDRAESPVEKSQDAYVIDLEARLRSCVEEHRDNILSWTADINSTRQVFEAGVKSRTDGLPSTEWSSTPKKTIKLTSVDVQPKNVHKIVLSQESNPALSGWLQTALKGKTLDDIFEDEVLTQEHRFVPNTHITLAFAGEASQEKMRAQYSDLIGNVVQFQVNGLYWDDRIMALGVAPESFTIEGEQTKLIEKEFVHITVWFREDAKAFEANKLLALWKEGKAQRIDLNPPFLLEGVLSFWEGSKSSRR